MHRSDTTRYAGQTLSDKTTPNTYPQGSQKRLVLGRHKSRVVVAALAGQLK